MIYRMWTEFSKYLDRCEVRVKRAIILIDFEVIHWNRYVRSKLINIMY